MHDGDRCNFTIPFTTEAINEIKDYHLSKRAYVSPEGEIRYKLDFDTITFVCHNLSD